MSAPTTSSPKRDIAETFEIGNISADQSLKSPQTKKFKKSSTPSQEQDTTAGASPPVSDSKSPSPAKQRGRTSSTGQLPSTQSTSPAKATSSAPSKPKTLPKWTPDDGVTECPLCHSGFNALLLRFKHHCRRCGGVICGNCSRFTSLPEYEINEDVRVCVKCFDKEVLRREKQAKKQQNALNRQQEDQKLNDLFERLHNAYEDSDEKLALVLKQEIDTLKESIYKREQRRMKKKEEKAAQKKEKEKVKKEKKEKPQSANATPSSDGKASTTQSKTDKPKKQIPNITGREDGFSSVRVEGEPDTKEQIRAKLDSRIKLDLKKLINPPRPGKACLVLDIDYTLFDHRWHTQVKEEWKKDKGQVIPEFQRPYLHQFLATCYEMYDLIIWSATGFTAIDSKCTNLGIYDNTTYKVTLVLSKEYMIDVRRKKKTGETFEETVKPLEVIWAKFPEIYTPKNTVHIDDVNNNFQLNPNNGIKITPFKEASKHRDDMELFYLTKYLLMISASEPNFSALNHRRWKEYIITKLWEKQTDYVIPEFDPKSTQPMDSAMLIAPPKSPRKITGVISPVSLYPRKNQSPPMAGPSVGGNAPVGRRRSTSVDLPQPNFTISEVQNLSQHSFSMPSHPQLSPASHKEEQDEVNNQPTNPLSFSDPTMAYSSNPFIMTTESHPQPQNSFLPFFGEHREALQQQLQTVNPFAPTFEEANVATNSQPSQVAQQPQSQPVQITKDGEKLTSSNGGLVTEAIDAPTV